jgi:amino-acid N-acetyltransferase
VTRLPYAGLEPSTPRADTKAAPAPRNPESVNRLLEADLPLTPAATEREELHVALVKIRALDEIPDGVLRGVGRTLESLKRLGLHTIVVLSEPGAHRAERLISAIEASRGKARRVDGALTQGSDTSELAVSLPDLLLAPLQRGVVPILLPAAYDTNFRTAHVDANDIVTALTRLFAGADAVSLDRLIFLDPLGGIPAPDRPAGAHVFVNMEQEYHDISASLEKSGEPQQQQHHLRSLQTLRKSLSLLPPTTSAVITTAASAASTERAKNPLIHNLLTDKPMFSSSLPTATSPSTQTTVLKHGTPLLLFPSGTRLTDSAIDLKKLVALIEDSFGKRLDVEHYLARVDRNIAGLIVAGDYDGAAIVTWEGKRVCYLDKFAVAKRSQGVGGVADVVFKAMTAGVRKGGLFEGAEGIVWRSRRTNVVNKWVCPRRKKGGGRGEREWGRSTDVFLTVF